MSTSRYSAFGRLDRWPLRLVLLSKSCCVDGPRTPGQQPQNDAQPGGSADANVVGGHSFCTVRPSGIPVFQAQVFRFWFYLYQASASRTWGIWSTCHMCFMCFWPVGQGLEECVCAELAAVCSWLWSKINLPLETGHRTESTDPAKVQGDRCVELAFGVDPPRTNGRTCINTVLRYARLLFGGLRVLGMSGWLPAGGWISLDVVWQCLLLTLKACESAWDP